MLPWSYSNFHPTFEHATRCPVRLHAREAVRLHAREAVRLHAREAVRLHAREAVRAKTPAE